MQKLFGIDIQHSFLSLWVLENMLNTFRPNRIIETGTGCGGLTVYLGLWALNNSAYVLSIDLEKKIEYKPLKLIVDCLPVELLHLDVFSEKFKYTVKQWLGLKDGPVMFYCDGGKKTQELLAFGELIPPGSVIGCHDYGTEVFTGEIDARMQDMGFETCVDLKEMKELYTLQMFWKKK